MKLHNDMAMDSPDSHSLDSAVCKVLERTLNAKK
jgi:hypothetical protein